MRIALATSSYAPYIGGVEEHVRNVARLLHERGHDVVIWSVERSGGFEVTTIDGIEVWNLPGPLPARSILSMMGFVIRLPHAWRLWHKALLSHRPDLIHVHCFGPNGTYARWMSRASRLPLILSAHGETIADDFGLFTNSRFAVWSLRRSIAEADAVTGCSQVAIDDLVNRFGLEKARGTVVFNGIDSEEALGSLPNGVGARYIAAIGRAQRVKGFDLLLSAFARANLPTDVQLVIGGGGPELDALQAEAARLGLGERVVFPGWLDRVTVTALRRNALIGIVPSRIEPFGIAVLEIWRAGSPLIATTRGGPPEFVSDNVNGLLVDPEDVDALARSLTLLIDDRTFANTLAIAGSERVKFFTWEHTVDAYEAIYRRNVAAVRG